MYIPEHFEVHDEERVTQLIMENSFGLLLTHDSKRPFGSHIPFLYESGRLYCHLARSNPQVEQLTTGKEVLAVFNGPHAYVSPSWYESPAPPTWNYAVVHVYGTPKLMTDRTQLQDLVEKLADYFEAGEPEAWDQNYDAAMLDHIVGFEITVTQIQGKFKLSQNRPEIDRANVIDRLMAKGSDNSVATATLMKEMQGE